MSFCQKSITFTPDRGIPPLEGRVILVTGANIGLGKQCVLEYARHNPAQIWLAARNLDKAKEAVNEIQEQLPTPAPIKLLELDLASLESVKRAAASFNAQSSRLDILMLNAGRMAAPPELSTDGFELQFATNYLGHALLAKLLLPTLENTAKTPGADVRIISVSSYGHSLAPKTEGIRFDALRTAAAELGPYGCYGQSKLAQILWTKKMAKLYPQFTLASIHPGVVKTNLMNNATGSSLAVRLLGKIANRVVTSVDQGAKNQLWASVAKGVKSGEYYEPVGVANAGSELTKDDALMEKLWDWTEEALGQHAA